MTAQNPSQKKSNREPPMNADKFKNAGINRMILVCFPAVACTWFLSAFIGVHRRLRLGLGFAFAAATT
jgi:hypothetical protein